MDGLFLKVVYGPSLAIEEFKNDSYNQVKKF